MPSNLEWAWTAGLMDGDGSISIQKRTNPEGFRKPIAVVDNTDREILEELLRLHGGSLVIKRRYKDHHRQAWSWRLYGSNHVRAFLIQTMPYMHNSMKKERARMLVEEWLPVTPRNGYYTPEMRLLKQEFEARFMALGDGRGSRSI